MQVSHFYPSITRKHSHIKSAYSYNRDVKGDGIQPSKWYLFFCEESKIIPSFEAEQFVSFMVNNSFERIVNLSLFLFTAVL